MGDMNTTGVSAIGIANIAMDGTVLDTWYPHPELSTDDAHQWRDIGEPGTVRLGAHDLSPRMLSLVRLDEDRMVEQVAVRTTIADLSQPPIDAHDVYLRLHLLSHRLVRPHELNMEGVYQKLTTVVWTNKGPCLPDNFEFVRTSLRSRGLIHVYGIDHLPRMVDYVVPTGVRIAEAERVRLGAYLASGTEVLREGFISYNAGTLGPATVEGCLYSGVTVGEGAVLQHDSSVVSNALSNGDRPALHVGASTVLGVNSTLMELSLGDNCLLGPNLLIEPDTTLYFADDDRLAPASTIAGEDGWSIVHEPGNVEPVARKVADTTSTGSSGQSNQGSRSSRRAKAEPTTTEAKEPRTKKTRARKTTKRTRR